MRVFRVYVSGSHSTGKTEIVRDLAGFVEKEFGVPVVVVAEVARSCPMPVNRGSSPESQFWIYEAQRKAEAQARDELARTGSKFGFILSDRSNFDNLAYALNIARTQRHVGWEWVGIATQTEFASQSESPGATLHLFTAIDETRAPLEDGFRDTDRAWQKEIQEEIRAMCSGPGLFRHPGTRCVFLGPGDPMPQARREVLEFFSGKVDNAGFL
jgi:hypothetical protein